MSTRPTFKSPEHFFRRFPGVPADRQASSPHTVGTPKPYICFSLALGDTEHVWTPEPEISTRWLDGIPRNRAISTFERLFQAFGYVDCKMDISFSRGVRKVAIYAKHGTVTHAAIQHPDKDGKWHSKMGMDANIYHNLDEIEGDAYGKVVLVMKQQQPAPTVRVMRDRLVVCKPE